MSPIRAPIKSAPFPWNISKHFDGSGFPPAGSLESVTPPPPHPLLQPTPPSPPPPSPRTSHLMHLSAKQFSLRDGGSWGGGVLHGAIFSREPLERAWEEDALWAAGRAWHGFHRLVPAAPAVTSGRLGSGIFWNAKQALGLCDLRLASEKVI